MILWEKSDCSPDWTEILSILADLAKLPEKCSKNCGLLPYQSPYMTDKDQSKTHHREFDARATTDATRGYWNVSQSPHMADEVKSKTQHHELNARATTPAIRGNTAVSQSPCMTDEVKSETSHHENARATTVALCCNRAVSQSSYVTNEVERTRHMALLFGMWQCTLPVKKKKQHISCFSATMANAKFLFLRETPRNKQSRQNHLRKIPRCFSVKFLCVSPRKVITWVYRSKSLSRSSRRNLKIKTYNNF